MLLREYQLLKERVLFSLKSISFWKLTSRQPFCVSASYLSHPLPEGLSTAQPHCLNWLSGEGRAKLLTIGRKKPHIS